MIRFKLPTARQLLPRDPHLAERARKARRLRLGKLKQTRAYAPRRHRNIRADNTSGTIGVSRHRDKWFARIMYDGKSYYIGTYETCEEASQARKQMEARLFGP